MGGYSQRAALMCAIQVVWLLVGICAMLFLRHLRSAGICRAILCGWMAVACGIFLAGRIIRAIDTKKVKKVKKDIDV